MPKAATSDEIGLALSGGGFRATLFHVGSLWRLNELGWLPKVNRYSSVSGGSITAALLGLRWHELQFDAQGISPHFVSKIATPLRTFCSKGIDVSAGLEGLLSFHSSISDKVTEKYADGLFGNATLQDFPKGAGAPRFTLYATNLQTGSSFRFSQPFLADYRIGMIEKPTLSLASAVAASSAFPPVLSPVILKFPANAWKPLEGADCFSDELVELRTQVSLTDGGVYDNLGLEGIWDRCGTVLVSDAGAPLDVVPSAAAAWTEQSLRVMDIVTNQARALRKRRLVNDFIDQVRKGSYWGIRTRIDDYGLASALMKDSKKSDGLCQIRTRLNTFTAQEQGYLINWGYALADAAMRKHVVPGVASTPQWPVPEFHLG
ncbi:patatin-like phospholipase family protein [Roseateles sp. DC23W]|uniref:Patatin-like phospholipase family protein n=1 Tax=Pelomonas dachongensis TaxID=3299029 RepID=A0ABW7EU10_9BURK